MENHPDGTWRVDGLIRYLQTRIAREKDRAGNAEQLRRRLVHVGIRMARKFGWNDTDTFTKWIGEQYIAHLMKDHSLTIVRPAIICSTMDDPFAGWVEGTKVIDVLIMGYVLGKLKIYPALADATVDLIPADLAANAVVVCLADMLRWPNRKTIVQCASSTTLPITVRELTRHCLAALSGTHQDLYDLVQKSPPAAPPVWSTRVPLRTLMRIRRAAVSLEKTVGRWRSPDVQKRIAKKAKTIDNAWNNLDVLSFYARPDYVFETAALDRLHASLADTDRSRFPVSALAIDWPSYLEAHIGGLKDHVVGPAVERRRQAKENG